ncbi:ATP-binding protein [Microlunatus ginsengisoli]|uniref:MoxR family ATPase n=1 Tax=Microlunatus ginsengisoli TaxID=363863 RepID=A0ABP7AKF8_9ACTN
MSTSTPMMRALAASIRAGVPALVWGNPGIGKTSVVTSLASAWNWHVETVIGSIREATDFLGFGVEVDGGEGRIGHVAYAPPGWARAAAQADRALVFFDELTTAPPSVRKAMLRVLQERYAGDFALPDTVALVAAANPPESAVDGYDLEPPMANRLIHLDFDFAQTAWLDGLTGGFDTVAQPSMNELIGPGDDQHRAQVRGAVTAFLRTRPDLIEPGVPSDPVQAGRAWPSRRSWTNAIAAVSEIRPDDTDAACLLLAGAVGEGPAREYLTFRRELDLPTPEQVIADADKINWAAMRPDRAFAVAGALRAYALGNRADKTTWLGAINALSAMAENGLPDIAQGAVAALLTNHPGDVPVPRRVVDAFTDLFVGMGRWAA